MCGNPRRADDPGTTASLLASMLLCRRLAPVRLPFALMSIALMAAVGLLLYGAAISDDILDQHRPHLTAEYRVAAAVSRSHVYLEEHLSGDRTVDVSTDVLAPLTSAANECEVMLVGGEMGQQIIIPTTDPAARALDEMLCAELDTLVALTQQRLAAGNSAEAGTQLDAEFDIQFEAVLESVDASTSRFEALVQEDRRAGQIVTMVTIGVVTVLFGGMAIILVRSRYRIHRLLAGARKEADQAGVLNRLSERLSFALTEVEIVHAATAAVRQLVQAEGGDLLLLNPSSDRLTVAAAWGIEAPENGSVLTVARPDQCPGIRRAAPYAIEDAGDELAVRCGVHPGRGAQLCVPLIALGQTIGVVHLEQAEGSSFDPATTTLATRVAERTAMALANGRLLRRLEEQAMTDPLTGLYNARFFDPLLERELSMAERDGTAIGILMVDLDHFKRFNDAYGHPAGDEALRAFAQAMRRTLRDSDVIARYGGEEFAVLLRRADFEAAQGVAEKLRRATAALAIDVGPGRYGRLTASIGVASSAVHGNDRMLLMRLADQALYRAKQLRRDRVVAADASFTAVSPASAGDTPDPSAPHPLGSPAHLAALPDAEVELPSG